METDSRQPPEGFRSPVTVVIPSPVHKFYNPHNPESPGVKY